MGVKDAQVTSISTLLGLDVSLLRELMKLRLSEANINEFGRFDKLVASVDRAKAKAYFEAVEGVAVSTFATSSKSSKLLRDFLLKGGFDLDL